MTPTIVLAAALSLVSSVAGAQPNKPVERDDGSLDYSKLSDREVAEFSATQMYLINRRLSTYTGGFIMSMQTLEALPKDTANMMLGMSLDQDRVLLRSTVPAVPNIPGAREQLNEFLSLPKR